MSYQRIGFMNEPSANWGHSYIFQNTFFITVPPKDMQIVGDPDPAASGNVFFLNSGSVYVMPLFGEHYQKVVVSLTHSGYGGPEKIEAIGISNLIVDTVNDSMPQKPIYGEIELSGNDIYGVRIYGAEIWIRWIAFGILESTSA